MAWPHRKSGTTMPALTRENHWRASSVCCLSILACQCPRVTGTCLFVDLSVDGKLLLQTKPRQLRLHFSRLLSVLFLCSFHCKFGYISRFSELQWRLSKYEGIEWLLQDRRHTSPQQNHPSDASVSLVDPFLSLFHAVSARRPTSPPLLPPATEKLLLLT